MLQDQCYKAHDSILKNHTDLSSRAVDIAPRCPSILNIVSQLYCHDQTLLCHTTYLHDT